MKKIIPVIIILVLVMVFYSIQRPMSEGKDVAEQEVISDDENVPLDEGLDTIRNDSFIVIYKQPVKGYMVKAVAKLAVSDVDIISADLTFTKDGQSFKLHTKCFGDSIFCKGRLDYDFENPDLFRKYHNTTIYADYHEYREKGELMPMYTPFFFRDLDFDGIEELIIVHRSMGVRFHDGYDIYRIVEGKPILIDYPPYNDNKDYWGFGMTDYPEFDYKTKTISCPYEVQAGHAPHGEEPPPAHHATARPRDDETDILQTEIRNGESNCIWPCCPCL